jgi:uncharacterized protein (TIGR03067 family)
MISPIAMALAGLLSLAVDAPQDTTPSDRDRLQGDWVCVSMERNGEPIPPERYKGGRLRIEGDTFTYTLNDRLVSKGIRKLDPSQKPKAMDDTHTEGRFKGRSYLGIYELNGDEFKTCNGGYLQKRPTEFATKPGSGLLLAVYKRVKP